MKQLFSRSIRQRGVATTVIALILLVGITLVVLISSKTVLVETQISANHYRNTQAEAVASAAMDRGIAYFMAGGIDQIDNATGAAGGDNLTDFTEPSAAEQPSAASCAMPTTPAAPITLAASGQTTLALYYFDNTPGNQCDCPPGNDCFNPTIFGVPPKNRARIVAMGWSDDCSATRTISQCLGAFDIFNGGKSPNQPFVLQAGVGAFGNAKIINRYNNSSIWSGSILDTSSAAFGTYLRPSNTEISDYTKAELDDENEALNTQLVSNRDAGAGIDVISGDPNLANTTGDEFYNLFFAIDPETFQRNANEQGQLLAAGTAPPNGTTGMVWIGPTGAPSATLTNIGGAGTVLGDPQLPIILVVNGPLKITGGTVFGVIYVRGELSIAGNPVVKGSIISESVNNTGAGTLRLVYVPYGDESIDVPFIPGTGAVVAGSWRDWN